MTWAKTKKAKAPKKATLHRRKRMKQPRSVLTDPWKHIGMARGQK
jgi:hypothetical protein